MQKGCTLNVYRCNHIFITLLEDGTLDVQEEGGHNISFILGTCHDSILGSAEEEDLTGNTLLFRHKE
jgi:hypothetical protein